MGATHGQTTSSAPSQRPPLPPWLFNYCSDNTVLLVFTFRCNIHSLKNSFHENRSKSYVNRMNVKLHLRKHNLKRQMCSAPYWLSPATLREILRHGCDSHWHNHTECVTCGSEAPRTSRDGSRAQSSSANKLAWSCGTAGVKRSHRIQARACGPLNREEKQAGLPITQNSLFPYLSFQERMLASKLLKNV